MTTREQAMEALQTRLQSAYSFGAVTRRLVSPETIASPGAPALVLIKHHEDYTRKGPTVPPIRTMTVMAIVYIDVGSNVNAIPDSVINPIQDAIDTALLPDDSTTGSGGGVRSCASPSMVTGSRAGLGTSGVFDAVASASSAFTS